MTTQIQKQNGSNFVKATKMMETRPFDYIYGKLKEIFIKLAFMFQK